MASNLSMEDMELIQAGIRAQQRTEPFDNQGQIKDFLGEKWSDLNSDDIATIAAGGYTKESQLLHAAAVARTNRWKAEAFAEAEALAAKEQARVASLTTWDEAKEIAEAILKSQRAL